MASGHLPAPHQEDVNFISGNEGSLTTNAQKRAQPKPIFKSPWSDPAFKKRYIEVLKTYNIEAICSSTKWVKDVMRKTGASGDVRDFQKFVIKSLPEILPQLGAHAKEDFIKYKMDIKSWILDPNHPRLRALDSDSSPSDDEDPKNEGKYTGQIEDGQGSRDIEEA